MNAAATIDKRRPHYQTLILNADYLPLTVWPLSLEPSRDQVMNVIDGTVDMVDEWPASFRTPSREIVIPKVVALRYYVPINSNPKWCRRSVILRDDFRCQYCGKEFASADLTFDHVLPRAAGGQTCWENVVMACVSCNAKKAAAMPSHSGSRARGDWRPLKPPARPSTAQLLRAGLKLLDPSIREDFASWLYWSEELRA